MPSGPGKFYRVAIVGASSLLGKELKQVLEDRNFPATDVVLLDESPMAGTLTEAGGEPTFIRALEEDSFEGAQFAFFAGSAADGQRNWKAAQSSKATVIDFTGAVAASGEAAKSSIPSLHWTIDYRPSSEAAGNAANLPYASPSTPVIIACTLVAGLKAFDAQRLSVTLFPPVSERGQAGIDELESQSASLLSFHEIEKSVFDTQVAFNLLTGYGEASKPTLAETRTVVARDVAGFVKGRGPVPAIQLVQAPVFYGYAFSAFAELKSPLDPAQIEKTFSGIGVKFGEADEMAPSNVSVAGESDIRFARIERDPNAANSIWIWGAADNLRLAATNAVRIAEEIIAGPVQ
jgi:aspartate-semialdehyde dehydrogenase